MERFRVLLGLLIKYHTALGYSLLSLLTAGGERLLSSVAFQCPCSATWNLRYSLVFLLVPALILFLLGFLFSTRAKRAMTGCCAWRRRGKEESGEEKPGKEKPGKEEPGKEKPGEEKPGEEEPRKACRNLGPCCSFTWTAFLAPAIWIAVSLLGGGFYECAAGGTTWMVRWMCTDQEASCLQELPKAPCQEEKPEKVQEILRKLKAQSQVIGWSVIVVIVLALLISTYFKRCVSTLNFHHLRSHKLYCQKKEEILMNETEKRATELAAENVKCFFDGSQLKEVKMPNDEDWEKISLHRAFKPKSQCYSILHN